MVVVRKTREGEKETRLDLVAGWSLWIAVVASRHTPCILHTFPIHNNKQYPLLDYHFFNEGEMLAAFTRCFSRLWT